jgi:hypothetical protein
MPAISPILLDSSIACYRSSLDSFKVKFESKRVSFKDLIWSWVRGFGLVNRDWKRWIRREVLVNDDLARVVMERVNFWSFGENWGRVV